MGVMTRAKFTCVSERKYKGWGTSEYFYEYEFQVVTSGSDENKKFFASSPAGTIKISTVAAKTFEVGAEYYTDFTPAVMPEMAAQ